MHGAHRIVDVRHIAGFVDDEHGNPRRSDEPLARHAGDLSHLQVARHHSRRAACDE